MYCGCKENRELPTQEAKVDRHREVEGSAIWLGMGMAAFGEAVQNDTAVSADSPERGR